MQTTFERVLYAHKRGKKKRKEGKESQTPSARLTSKNLAVHRSIQTPSPLFKSPSKYFSEMHFIWHELTSRLKTSVIMSSSETAISICKGRRVVVIGWCGERRGGEGGDRERREE